MKNLAIRILGKNQKIKCHTKISNIITKDTIDVAGA